MYISFCLQSRIASASWTGPHYSRPLPKVPTKQPVGDATAAPLPAAASNDAGPSAAQAQQQTPMSSSVFLIKSISHLGSEQLHNFCSSCGKLYSYQVIILYYCKLLYIVHYTS